MVGRVIEVSPVASGAEERVSLDIYNACWPRDAVTVDEVHWFKELHTPNEKLKSPIRRPNAEFGYRPGIGRVLLHGLPAAE